ncbi:hypothetical protein NFC81_08975 [Salinispirillum sp. LH 10-3-1]|uniref:Uncharacterized protein n=1 Tax=Salinispirillum sp. LH 10-3-1 TaxID=2952525 RepID=A0AB38YCH4_9GAMM
MTLGSVVLSGCKSAPQSDDIATDALILNLVVVRHNDQLVVQATLGIEDLPYTRAELSGEDKLLVRLNNHEYTMNAQWNGVYSNEIPYEEGILELDFLRSEAHQSAPSTLLHLPVSPEFHSPEDNEIFDTQNNQYIPLGWTGVPTENGRYEVRCSSRKQGISQTSGTFQAINRQSLSLSIDELIEAATSNNERAFCQVVFTLRGVSDRGVIAPQLASGSVHFESFVSRSVIVRHNALFQGTDHTALYQ